MEAAARKVGQRSLVFKRGEFSSNPRDLRDNVEQLDALLQGSEASVRRRVRLMFGELMSEWQGSFAGDPIAVSLELLPRSVRLTVADLHRALADEDWEQLVTPSILDLVHGWGIDRRGHGGAWFEFEVAGQPSLASSTLGSSRGVARRGRRFSRQSDIS